MSHSSAASNRLCSPPEVRSSRLLIKLDTMLLRVDGKFAHVPEGISLVNRLMRTRLTVACLLWCLAERPPKIGGCQETDGTIESQAFYLRTKLKLSKRNGIVRVSSVNSFKAAPLPIYMFSFFYLQHTARSRFWSSSLKNHPPLWSDNLAWLERKPLLVGSHHASSRNTVYLLEIEPAFPLSDTVIPRNKLICGRAAGIGEAG